MATSQRNSLLSHLCKVTLLAKSNELTDRQLLERFINGRDEAAFEALVRRHGPMVLGVCQRVLHHAHDAEDAFQATFLVLARKAASLSRRELVSNWLYGVAYRAALETRAARPERERQVIEMPEPCGGNEAEDWSELRPILDQELDRLPEKYRVAVVLCDLEGRTRRAAARQLGIPEGTLSGRLTTARRTLAQRLRRRGLALSGGAFVAMLSPGATLASLPAPLVITTTKAAINITAGSTATSAVSAKVAAITKGVMKTMLLRKLKGVTSLFLVCLAFGSVFLLVWNARATDRVRLAPVAAQDRPAAKAAAPRAKAPAPPRGGEFFSIETDTILTVAFAPDSKLLAGGGADKKVRVWDMSNNKLKWTLEEPKGMVRKVVFSKDGKTLAAGADDASIYLWNAVTGKLDVELHADLPRKLPKKEDKFSGHVFVNGLVFLPGGKIAAAYNYEPLAGGAEQESQIKIWDLNTKKETTLHKQTGSVYSLALSPDGTLLAAALQGEIEGFRVWDLESRKVVWEEKASADFMSGIAFSPDGKTLAVGGGHAIHMKEGVRVEARLWLFDAKTKKQLWHTKEPGNWAYSQIAFMPDSKGLLTGSSGPTRPYELKGGGKGQKVVSEMRNWDVATGKVTWKAEGELGDFKCVAVSPDGKILAGGDSEQLMVFDPGTGVLREVLMKVTYGPLQRE